MPTTTILAVISAFLIGCVFLIAWWTGHQVRKAMAALDAQSETVNQKLEVIRKDVNSNLTAALTRVELLEITLKNNGILIPEIE